MSKTIDVRLPVKKKVKLGSNISRNNSASLRMPNSNMESSETEKYLTVH